jgi:hypothetical protein
LQSAAAQTLRIHEAVAANFCRKKRKEAAMYNTRALKKAIVGALLAGSVAVSGVGLTTGTAQADPFAAQPHTWCPGQGLPFRGIEWDMGVCHTWYVVPVGQGNVRFAGSTDGSFVSADIPAPIFTPPPPPPPAPPHPFCTPRGGLIIIPPICDEIGVH